MITTRGQSANCVCWGLPASPNWWERQEMGTCGVCMGACPALAPGRVNPALPTASSGCKWLPASSLEISVCHCFLNLSQSGSFLFLLRTCHKGSCCLNEGLVSGGEQPSLLLQREKNTTWLLLQNTVCLVTGNGLRPGVDKPDSQIPGEIRGFVILINTLDSF